MKIYTIGHISPDLDCISAAVEYAEFLNTSKKYKDAQGNPAQVIPLRAGEPNNETNFVFNKFGATMPQIIDNITIEPTDKFILVDHNEASQRSPKVPEAQIIEIVDHHKVNLTFGSPIRIDVKPLGSTSSFVYEHFTNAQLQPTKPVLGLMLSAILDDTQGLKSSTTTGYDSTVAHEIAAQLSTTVEQETFELFKAKSDISGLTTMQIVKKDFKIFEFANKAGEPVKAFIGVTETVEPQLVINKKTEVIEALKQIKQQENVPQAYFFVVDILKVNSQAICCDQTETAMVEKAFTTVVKDNQADIGPRTSRKKDIAPALEKAIKEN